MPKRFKSWWDYHLFASAVRSSARFIHDRKILAFLYTLFQTSAGRHTKVEPDKVVWRAQLGYDTRPREDDGIEWDEEVPYGRERMKPPAGSAYEGRVNPRGIPCLYAASDKETAMSEVRPWLDSYVSIGQFRTMRELTLIDFSVGHDAGLMLCFDEPPPAEREKAVWTHIDQAFSRPITDRPDTAEYVPTQIIAEFFKNKGFDGVAYKSKLGPGYNIALFDLAAADLVTCSLCRVKGVKFDFGTLEMTYRVNKPSKPA